MSKPPGHHQARPDAAPRRRGPSNRTRPDNMRGRTAVQCTVENRRDGRRAKAGCLHHRYSCPRVQYRMGFQRAHRLSGGHRARALDLCGTVGVGRQVGDCWIG